MIIDWFTISAQVINFLILVFFLKRFLYRPILEAIDKREARINTQIMEAEQQKTAAEKKHEEYRKLMDEWETSQESRLKEAHQVAETEKKRLSDQVHNEAKELRARLNRAFQAEQQSMTADIQDSTRNALLTISQKVLADLANTDLESQIFRVFIEKIRRMDLKEKSKFNQLLKSPKQTITVASTFVLTEAMKSELVESIQALSGEKKNIDFLTDPELLSGIELSIGDDYKLGWNIAEYLTSLDNEIKGTSS